MEQLSHLKANGTTRLLIVDDEQNIRVPLVRALSILGYTVEEAESGQKAIDLLVETPFNLMVLDMRMPGMDGMQVMHTARRLQPYLLIIILTGHPTVDNAIAAIKSEAVDFLCKPVNVQQIAEAVKLALYKHARQSYQEQVVSALTQAFTNLQNFNQASLPTPPMEMLSENLITVYPLSLNLQTLRVIVTEGTQPKTNELSNGEAAVLGTFMTHPNQILSCRELVRSALEYKDVAEAEAKSIIRPYIFRLRQKIEHDSKKPQYIRTVRSRGYLLTNVSDNDKRVR